MTISAKPILEINNEAITLLYRELGPVNAARFLTQLSGGFGNYTRDRKFLLEKKSLDEIINEIQQDQQ